MARQRLGLLHTSASLVPVFAKLCRAQLPDVEVFNLVDDSLIADVISHGRLRPRTARRVAQHIAAAEDAGANVIMATCSSIGPAVETAESLAGVPVLRVDRPMADRAVAEGQRIGVIATLSTTLEPTAELIQRRATAVGKNVELVVRLCDGAFAALMSGDAKTHDELVAAALEELASRVDVIVLAQASMGRIVASMPTDPRRPPVLASPPLAVKHLATMFGNDDVDRSVS